MYDTKMAISIIILLLGIAEFVIGIWAAMLLYDESLHVLCTTTGKLASNTSIPTYLGGRDGAVVRELASHQCGRVRLPVPASYAGTLVFPSPQKPTHPNSNSILEVTPISILCLLPLTPM